MLVSSREEVLHVRMFQIMYNKNIFTKLLNLIYEPFLRRGVNQTPGEGGEHVHSILGY